MTGCYAWPTAVRTPTARSFSSPFALAPILTVICPSRRHGTRSGLYLRILAPRQARRLWPSHPGLRRRGPQDRASGHRRERPACGPRDHIQLRRARAAQQETDPAAAFVCFWQKDKGRYPIAYSVTSAAKEPSVSASESEEEDDEEGEKSRKRHKRRRRSPSPGGDGEEDGKRRKRKHKRKHRHDKESSRSKPAPPLLEESEPAGERKETEEEYDARLEREENERLAAARQRELERLKRKHEQETTQSTNGVRFKGISFLLFFLTSLMSRT